MAEIQSVMVKLVRRLPTVQYGYDEITLETYVMVEEGGDQQSVADQLAAWNKQLNTTAPFYHLPSGPDSYDDNPLGSSAKPLFKRLPRF